MMSTEYGLRIQRLSMQATTRTASSRFCCRPASTPSQASPQRVVCSERSLPYVPAAPSREESWPVAAVFPAAITDSPQPPSSQRSRQQASSLRYTPSLLSCWTAPLQTSPQGCLLQSRSRLTVAMVGLPMHQPIPALCRAFASAQPVRSSSAPSAIVGSNDMLAPLHLRHPRRLIQ